MFAIHFIDKLIDSSILDSLNIFFFKMIVSILEQVENIMGKGENMVSTSILSISNNVFKGHLL